MLLCATLYVPVHNATAMFSDPEGGSLEIGAEFPLNQCVELKSCVGSQAGRNHENAEPRRLGGFGLNNTFNFLVTVKILRYCIR